MVFDLYLRLLRLQFLLSGEKGCDQSHDSILLLRIVELREWSAAVRTGQGIATLLGYNPFHSIDV